MSDSAREQSEALIGGVWKRILADIAPTILALLGVAAPPEMTGHSLLSPK